MPPFVMAVVLLAACLHASWNFLVKRTEDKHLSMTAVVIGRIPFAAAALVFVDLPKPESLAYVLAGAVLHTGYQFFLLNSYRIGDLSQVYPLARGVAPLIVACVSVVLLGIDLSRLELAAIVTIGAGIMSLALARRRDGLRNVRAAALAIMTGGFIAAYSLVDGLGARTAGTSLGFYASLSILNAILYTSIMRVIRPGFVKRAARSHFRLALSGGGASFTAYALVVWAFTVAPIALVASLRDTSIVIALILGVVLLKERLDAMKVAATLLVMLGVIMLRLGR